MVQSKELGYSIGLTQESDVQSVVELIQSCPEALLPVAAEQVSEWVSQGHSLVAKIDSGEVIGHQAVAIWPQSGWYEVRSAIVKPEFRGKGVNTKMKIAMINQVRKVDPLATIVGVTETASQSRGILQKLGFQEIPLNELNSEFFTVCPMTCFRITGVDCGCKAYILGPDQPFNYGT